MVLSVSWQRRWTVASFFVLIATTVRLGLVCAFAGVELCCRRRGCSTTTTTPVGGLVQRYGRSEIFPFSNTRLSFSYTNNNKEKNDNNNADFAYQEMKVLLNAMRSLNVVRRRDLDPATGDALTAYVQEVVVRNQKSNIAAPSVPGSTWRLAFESSSNNDNLPRDATVEISFLRNQDTAGNTASTNIPNNNRNTLLYSLVFGEKTAGLKRLDVACFYNNNGESNNRLTFVYDKVTMDAFGWRNVELCFFGLLKGRTNQIATAYCDHSIWIEAASAGEEGATTTPSWNVYVRQAEATVA